MVDKGGNIYIFKSRLWLLLFSHSFGWSRRNYGERINQKYYYQKEPQKVYSYRETASYAK